jgi:hypothetical protein
MSFALIVIINVKLVQLLHLIVLLVLLIENKILLFVIVKMAFMMIKLYKYPPARYALISARPVL